MVCQRLVIKPVTIHPHPKPTHEMPHTTSHHRDHEREHPLAHLPPEPPRPQMHESFEAVKCWALHPMVAKRLRAEAGQQGVNYFDEPLIAFGLVHLVPERDRVNAAAYFGSALGRTPSKLFHRKDYLAYWHGVWTKLDTMRTREALRLNAYPDDNPHAANGNRADASGYQPRYRMRRESAEERRQREQERYRREFDELRARQETVGATLGLRGGRSEPKEVPASSKQRHHSTTGQLRLPAQEGPRRSERLASVSSSHRNDGSRSHGGGHEGSGSHAKSHGHRSRTSSTTHRHASSSKNDYR